MAGVGVAKYGMANCGMADPGSFKSFKASYPLIYTHNSPFCGLFCAEPLHNKQNYNLSGGSFTSIEMHLIQVFPSPKKLQVSFFLFCPFGTD